MSPLEVLRGHVIGNQWTAVANPLAARPEAQGHLPADDPLGAPCADRATLGHAAPA